jgi:hypothetical protein
MRALAPVVYVPELQAYLITRRDDIFAVEKKIAYFSSEQPQGLMTQLMGQNMMRKDGEAHMDERRAIFPTVSPKTVRDVWKTQFVAKTHAILDRYHPLARADLVEMAKEISGEALIAMTGLHTMTWQDMDRVSQGMIDGCANYSDAPAIEAHCHDCTAFIDRSIDECLTNAPAADHSLLAVQAAAGLCMAQIRANIKLVISGGQNEPRDVIAGLAWALLQHPRQMGHVMAGDVSWAGAMDEYLRWMSPIGMSPREMAQDYDLHGITLVKGARVFLMFGAGNRDERVFARPDTFDMTQDCAASIAFGAGPHFCAGAWAARCLIAEVAMPALFENLKGLRLTGDVHFGGWAFRGPFSVPVKWDA